MPSDGTEPSTKPAELSPGSVIGRKYRLDGRIAEGGMGIVYRGWHVVLEQPIAIKVVRPEYSHHPEAVARFLNEARAIARLRGIHVARVLDTGRIENGPPYMVLEYLEGRDLRTLLESDGPLELERAVDYVLQTCEAMAEAHSLGVIHRDLKPENLFLTEQPDGSELLKVLDFGISKRLAAEGRSYTLQGQSLGSPHYMAPEQMSSPDKVDARADVWSLGVVLFELLTNQVPFAGETLPVACVKVLCDEPISLRSLRPDVPADVETVVRRCLQKHPEERFPSVKELAEALAPFASAECAESLRRVRRILGEPAPARASFRPLGEVRDGVNDSTPVPSARTTGGLASGARARPLWPVAMVLAAAASLAILTRSDPRALQQMSVIAGQRLEGVARAGVRAAAGAAERAVDWVGSQKFEVRINASRPVEELPAPPSVSPNPTAPVPPASASSSPSAAIRSAHSPEWREAAR
ncbi:MAG TPA: serine/threonine-protein kinase [Polyangiaceae bacterium]|nr:serine/threonine-protein kinase [Polyangiaceae bacterium]